MIIRVLHPTPSAFRLADQDGSLAAASCELDCSAAEVSDAEP